MAVRKSAKKKPLKGLPAPEPAEGHIDELVDVYEKAAFAALDACAVKAIKRRYRIAREAGIRAVIARHNEFMGWSA